MWRYRVDTYARPNPEDKYVQIIPSIIVGTDDDNNGHYYSPSCSSPILVVADSDQKSTYQSFFLFFWFVCATTVLQNKKLTNDFAGIPKKDRTYIPSSGRWDTFTSVITIIINIPCQKFTFFIHHEWQLGSQDLLYGCRLCRWTDHGCHRQEMPQG